MSRPAGAAKLPALPVVNTGNPALDRWIQAASERLEVREGTRGNPHERAVTLRELAALGLTSTSRSAGGSSASAGVLVKQPDGTYNTLTIDAFAESIRATALYKNLIKKLDDVTRFDEVPAEVRAILLRDIAAEAARRGADIQRLDMKMQSSIESLAYTVQEVTASVQAAAAGVRDTTFAMANDTRAMAGKVTQVQARLDNVGGVTIEESMLATADRVAGLAGEYMVKINAGGAVAGFGLAASEDPLGNTASSFIVQADKFAVAMPGLSSAIPFGVDASGVYINGTLRVNAGGTALQDSLSGTSNGLAYAYKRSATDLIAPWNSSTNGPGAVTWTFASGSITTPATNALLNGWTKTIPVGTDPLYVTVCSAVGTDPTDTVAATEWATPALLAQSGTNGLSVATAILYRRNASATVAPSVQANTVTFTFASGGMTGMSAGWTSAIPDASNGAYLWVTQATASATTPTDTLAAGEWSAPVLFVQDGAAGTNGLNGANGLPGAPGADGVTLYTWVAYANNITGTSGFTTGANTGQTHIGLANNKTTATESTDPTQYTWSLIQGAAGVPGTPGVNGTTTYTWFAYANNSTGTSGFTTGAWTNQTYLGISPNRTTATESTNPADYSWSLIQGATGANGANGTNGANGAPGAPGAPGPRGSQTFYASGSSWSDTTANNIVTSVTGSATRIIGDTVVISNGTNFAQTRYWSGASWVPPGVVIDGNLLVNGTLSTSKLIAGSITGFNIQTAASGVRWSLDGVTNAALFRGTNALGNTTVNMDAGQGTIECSGFAGSSFSSSSSALTLNVGNSSSGIGLRAEGNTGAAVQGGSLSGHGGVFLGNSTRAPLMINHTTKPSNSATGSIMIYNVPGVGDRLCYCLGNTWYYLATNTIMP